MLRTLSRLLLFPSKKPSLVPRCGMNGKSTQVFPKFISLENVDNITEDNSGSRFRLVSYNILAQVYVKSSYFPHSPRSCLKWKARSHAVLAILKNFNSDFLCLQELDEFESFYNKELGAHGYLCAYVQRPGQKRDGCGIFYRPESVELLLKEEIDYNDIVRSADTGMIANYGDSADDFKDCFAKQKESILKMRPDDCRNSNDPSVSMKRDCVGLLTAFRLRTPCQRPIIIANTHIYWDPDWMDVKLAQVDYLLFRLARFQEVVSERFNCTPSVIIAGDFNSTPGDKVYQRIVQTCLSTEVADAESSIPLRSLYASIGGEPIFTNCTPNFAGTLDYIFFSNTGNLKPVGFLEVPGPESEEVVGGLPNYYHPSDHLPIGADFKLIT